MNDRELLRLLDLALGYLEEEGVDVALSKDSIKQAYRYAKVFVEYERTHRRRE